MSQEQVVAPFSHHLFLFRKAVIRILFAIACGSAVSLFFYQPLFDFLLSPFDVPLVFLGPFDGFFITLKVALISGIVLSSPLSCFFLIQFLFPALEKKEKRAFWIFFPL